MTLIFILSHRMVGVSLSSNPSRKRASILPPKGTSASSKPRSRRTRRLLSRVAVAQHRASYGHARASTCQRHQRSGNRASWRRLQQTTLRACQRYSTCREPFEVRLLAYGLDARALKRLLVVTVRFASGRSPRRRRRAYARVLVGRQSWCASS